MVNRRAIGARQEERALRYLQSQGFCILERNYRCRCGEIDLIAREGRTLVFLEVKYRRTDAYGDPAEAVDSRKQQRICRTADDYRLRHGIPEGQACRFDVVAICGAEIRLIRDAFSYC